MMRAACIRPNHGSLNDLVVEEIPRPPAAPKFDQVVVKVMAAGIAIPDADLVRDSVSLGNSVIGFFAPQEVIRIPGSDVAGIVEQVGAKVTKFKPGDYVFGDVGRERCGTFAEYVCTREHLLAFIPSGVCFEEAASLAVSGGAAIEAFSLIGGVKPGDKVLINGASGGFGVLAIQIAKMQGAHVTGVCNTSGVDLVTSLGADEVIDSARVDFTANSAAYDVVLDALGTKPLHAISYILALDGTYILVEGRKFAHVLTKGTLMSLLSEKKFMALAVMLHSTQHKLREISDLVASRKVKPIVDKIFALEEVREALAYAESKRVQGKVVIRIQHPTG